MRVAVVQARRRGQAIVEFGIVALLFTALMFAVVDFGLLLNTWLSVSSGSRQIARSASVGKRLDKLTAEAQRLSVPSVDTGGFATVCCDPNSALYLSVEYLRSSCIPGPCTPFADSELNPDYVPGGTCGLGPACHPLPDDYVRVTLVARGAQVITPLVRPAFGCTDGTVHSCYVPLTSATIMRYEGREF